MFILGNSLAYRINWLTKTIFAGMQVNNQNNALPLNDWNTFKGKCKIVSIVHTYCTEMQVKTFTCIDYERLYFVRECQCFVVIFTLLSLRITFIKMYFITFFFFIFYYKPLLTVFADSNALFSIFESHSWCHTISVM